MPLIVALRAMTTAPPNERHRLNTVYHHGRSGIAPVKCNDADGVDRAQRARTTTVQNSKKEKTHKKSSAERAIVKNTTS